MKGSLKLLPTRLGSFNSHSEIDMPFGTLAALHFIICIDDLMIVGSKTSVSSGLLSLAERKKRLIVNPGDFPSDFSFAFKAAICFSLIFFLMCASWELFFMMASKQIAPNCMKNINICMQ